MIEVNFTNPCAETLMVAQQNTTMQLVSTWVKAGQAINLFLMLFRLNGTIR